MEIEVGMKVRVIMKARVEVEMRMMVQVRMMVWVGIHMSAWDLLLETSEGVGVGVMVGVGSVMERRVEGEDGR